MRWPARALIGAVAVSAVTLAGVPGAAHAACSLPGGTAGAPEPVTPGRDTTGALPPAPLSTDLPARVDLKTPQRSRNRRWYFALQDGHLYVKPNVERTGVDGPWQAVVTPACLDGHLREISVDDDELIALDETRSIYTMDQALASPEQFNWTSRWGLPFWLGTGYTVPADARAWAWSVVSPREDQTWIDPAGNAQPIGEGKVSHIWSLSADGRRLTLNDPWLPLDRSYEMCGPYRARFESRSLAASGSTIFVMDRFGDMYTRLFDFDISGLDNLFFRYSYEDQRGQSNPAIQLPPAQWIHQPKVPGRITDLISIEKTGIGAIHRTMRVEGLDARGRTGYWDKDVTELGERAWHFHRTGAPLVGHRIPNPRADLSARTLGGGEDAAYALQASGWSAQIPDFHPSCDPDTLRVRFARGRFADFVLHVVDTIRTGPRARGLDDEPRHYTATIEVPDGVRADPVARAFVERELGGRRFTTVDLAATRTTLSFSDVGWTFTRRAPAPGETCVNAPAFRTARITPRGRALALALDTFTRSPAVVRIERVTAGRTVSRRLAAELLRTGSSTWRPPRARRAAGRYVVRLRALTPGGRIDERSFAFELGRRRFRALPLFTRRAGCGLLRRLALGGPAFGGRSRRPLTATVVAGEPARGRAVLRRGRRVVRRIGLGRLAPGKPRRVRIPARALASGAYTLRVRLTTPDGRAAAATVAARRY